MKLSKKSRLLPDFLKENLTRGPVLIAMHDNPDPDCLASALVLKRIFEEAHGRKAHIACSGVVGRAENRALVEECAIPLKPVNDLRLGSYAFTVLLDSQPGAGNNFLPPDFRVDAVVDHHPRRAGVTSRFPWCDIRPDYGATTTIALEYLLAHYLEPSRKEATALFYALKTETQDLGREACPADRRAYFHLLPLADTAALFRIAHAQVPRDYFRVVARALDNARLHGDTLAARLGAITLPDYVPEVADLLLRLQGVQVTFVSGLHRNTLYLSLRTLSRELQAGEIMHRLVEGLGTGGGHDMMAGGRVEIHRPEGAKAVERELVRRLLTLLSKKPNGLDLI